MNKAQKAGALWEQCAQAISTDGHARRVLSGHIELIILGTAEFEGPLWKERAVPPDGKIIKLDKFEDYLLRPEREGLGIESLYLVRNILDAVKGGDKALKLVRQEIQDFDKRSQGEKTEALTGKKTRVSPNRRRDDVSTAKRLERENPELWQQVTAGEISLNKAAIEMGYRPKMIQVRADDINAALDKLERHYNVRLGGVI